MATFNNTYESIAYRQGFYIVFFNDDIINDVTNDINASALLAQTKADALSAVNSISNQINTIGPPLGSASFTFGVATGSVTIFFEDISYPYPYNAAYTVIISVEATDPNAPTVVITVPVTVNSGVAYYPTANATCSTNLSALVIERYNGSSWEVYKSDNTGSLGPSYTNTGQPAGYVSLSTGSNTGVLWRAKATDVYGQTTTTASTNVNINAVPAIAWAMASLPVTVFNGAVNNIVALGSDPDTEGWGKLTNTNIDYNVNNTGFVAFAHSTSPGFGTYPFPQAGNPFTFNTNGTVEFRARAIDANNAQSDYIYYNVI